MERKVYLDGRIVPEKDAKISVFDHGLLYGDGVFEEIRSYNGRVFKLDEHITRLYKSAKAIMLSIPLTKDQMKNALLETLRANNLSDAYVRLVVTRGVGELGLDPGKCPNPLVFIIPSETILYPEELYRNGIELVTVPTRRNTVEALNPCIKSLNCLNSILAKIETNNRGAIEGIMLNSEGFVTGGIENNIFIVKKDNLLLTPPTWTGALEEVTRDVVMELAKDFMEVKEEVLTRYDLYNAQECLLTGTISEILPVVKIDGRIIGNGKVGGVTLRLMHAFRNLTQNEGTPIY